MTKIITDTTSNPVIPFLLHFSEQGIVPKIIDVEGSTIKFERVEGLRLSQWIAQGPDLKRMKALYQTLGQRVGYISKYHIEHGHLHTNHVVVEGEDNPVIIDWGRASYTGITDYSFWRGANSDALLGSTKSNLEELGRPGSCSRLEAEFFQRFEKELTSPLPVRFQQIRDSCLRKYGV